MGKRIVAGTLAALGTIALVIAFTAWNSCWGTPTADACLAASDANAGMLAAASIWLIALLICGVGLFASSTRFGATVSAVLLVIVNPLTDPGFFWAFDSADSTPGRGVIGALAILAAATIVALSQRAPAPSAGPAKVLEAV